MAISQSQLTKLGERLKKGPLQESDLRMLDEYRRSFGAVSEFVMQVLRDQMDLSPTARSAKSTMAIVDKLRRQSIRLGQIQDIAGCRVVVSDIAEQNRVLAGILARFPNAVVDDKRERPTFDYRAVHIIVKHDSRLVEIQIRTVPQHLWASLSEKMADIHGHEIKYGQGEEWPRTLLGLTSGVVARIEGLEVENLELCGALHPARTDESAMLQDFEVELLRQDIEELRVDLLRTLEDFIKKSHSTQADHDFPS